MGWWCWWSSKNHLYYGNGGDILVQRLEGIEYSVAERIDTSVREGVVQSTSVIPKMRDVKIRLNAQGLKPNTRMYAFFNNIQVTQYCVQDKSNDISSTIGVSGPSFETLQNSISTLKTDTNGNIKIIFNYFSNALDLNTGTYKLVLSDSSRNNPADTESFVETVFSSSGTTKNLVNEIVSTRNAVLNSRSVYDEREIYVGPPDPPPPPPPQDPVFETVVTGGTDETWPPEPPPPPPPTQPSGIDFVTGLYKYAFGREPDPEGYQYWNREFANRGISSSTLTSMSALVANNHTTLS